MKTCRYHPDRAAVALCMRCHAPICAGCGTQLDGINHCHACLTALAARPPRPPRNWSPVWSAGAVAVALWGLLFGLLLLAQGGLAP
jgi:hypothetical protein